MKKTIKMLIHDIFSFEMLKYMAVGVFTVIVDVVSYMLVYNYLPKISNITGILLTTIANIISWILATTFAFFTNKIFVFNSRHVTRKHFWYEFTTFYGGRLLSFGISELLLIILTDLTRFSPFWSKVIVTVLVIIANYILAKLVIFKKTESDFEKEVENLDTDVYIKKINELSSRKKS